MMNETGDRPITTANDDSVDATIHDQGRLEAEVAELKDRLLRYQADFDNLKRRTEREKAEFYEFAGMETVRQLLPAFDDFDRAMKMAPPDNEFAKGIALVHQRMLDSLKKVGLEPIEAVGKAFDPHLHEAIDRAETDEVEENTILMEHQRGFLFKGRLLRPALVKVAVKG
jgi:molecular chaperone GrpE